VPATQSYFTHGDYVTMVGAIVAFLFGVITTCVAIWLFYRGRQRTVRVTWINRKVSDEYLAGNRYICFDVTSTGATIYGLEVSLYIDARKVVRATGQSALYQQECNLNLCPHTNPVPPLNAGQTARFDLSLREFEDDPPTNYDLRKAIKDALMQLDFRQVSIRIYSDGKHELLKELCDPSMKAELDEFFEQRKLVLQTERDQLELDAARNTAHQTGQL
jgi:hypothetical protein